MSDHSNDQTAAQAGPAPWRGRVLNGDPPEGMPAIQRQTCAELRDLLYLASHDSSFSGAGLRHLVPMLTAHVDLGQQVLIRKGEWPVCFALWARMSDAAIGTLMTGGYAALKPADLTSGDRVVLVGIASPWRVEDFNLALGWCAANLGKRAAGDGGGQWYMVVPATDDMPARLTRYVRVDETSGRFEEARL